LETIRKPPMDVLRQSINATCPIHSSNDYPLAAGFSPPISCLITTGRV
jgi:hypothetical protein